ncbi:hypothetical protein SNE40_021574 [Patella caerulea]|uniref:Transmembrane protein 79 n=1 Tax=Patella caerulea TaxID=87958 RepID=A0AAN8J0M4_PATCE
MPKSRNKERERVFCLVKKAVLSMTSTLVVGYFLIPYKPPKLPTAFDRLIYTLRWQTLSVLTLVAGILKVAITRFQTTAIDPIAGNGEHHVIIDTHYIQNTVEQLFLNVIGQFILCTFLTSTQIKLIPIFVLLFVVGRITFWIGYKKSYLDRAFGFCLTMLPNMILYTMNLAFMLFQGPSSGFGPIF